MPQVGQSKFDYTEQGIADAKSYAKQTGLPVENLEYIPQSAHDSIDSLIMFNELQQYTQPYTTGVTQSFSSEQDFNVKRLNETIAAEGVIQQGPQYVEAGVPAWLADMATGGAGKGVSILKRLLGGMKSRKKFPIGYGQPTKRVSSQGTTDDAVKLLDELGFTKEGVMTKEAEILFGAKPSPTGATRPPRKVWK